ncbi:MAG: endolytic transglycosylase MltG [Eubacterium sp.]|nr:endolytic transglycosylase MltG [Eubacterium sp.]
MAKKNNKGYTVIIVLLAAVLAAVVGCFGYTYINNDISGNRNTDVEKTIYIADGSSQYDVGQKLLTSDIINSETIWDYWMNKNYPDFKYLGGEYYLNSGMSYDEIAKALIEPDVSHKTISVCIPEGYNIFDIASTMEDNSICTREDFLNACKDKTQYDYSFIAEIPDSETVAYPLEGFLFPATYDLEENMDAKDVVNQMLRAFADRISDSWRTYCADNYMTMYELITLASVVEKETLGDGVAENIASVFLNRLDASHQLQSDVTIDYGNALRANGFDDNVVTSYNTYKCAALPSGPICNPGVANIDAVVNHTDTDYFYFFSYNNGANFYFTDSYADFSAKWEEVKHTNTN